jgi:hypothetical protein
MTKRIWRAPILSLFVAAAAAAAAAPLKAQIDLDIKSGTTWADKLTLSQLTDMTFRWKSDARDAPYWQLTYSVPLRGDPTIVKSAAVSGSSSRLSDYSTFLVASTAIPTAAPSTFYIRLKIGAAYSSWIPVTVTGDTRAVLTMPAPPPIIAPPPVVQTAGVVNPDDPPLWVKLTHLKCMAPSDDGSANDEVYAVVGSVAINHEKPWTSTVWADVTPIMEGMNAGENRDLATPVWGPPSGASLVLRKTTDAVLLLALYEHDSGNPFIGKQATLSFLTSAAQGLNPDMSYPRMADLMKTAFDKGVRLGASDSDDWIEIASFITFTQEEIDAARAGKIIQKELALGFGDHGSYQLHIQMGKQGVSPLKW